MAAIGGSLRQLAIGGRVFAVAADNDVSRDLGGYSNEVLPNGDGTGRVIQTAKQWMLDGITVSTDPDNSDHEFIQDLADAGAFVDCQLTYADGTVYAGTGIPTGDVKYTNNNCLTTVNLQGPGKLEKQ